MQEAQEWIIDETKSANFGDKRLNKRIEPTVQPLINV
jgi:hypothetical protein